MKLPNVIKSDSDWRPSQLRIVLLLVAMSAAIFWIDWLLPLGVAAGVPYVAVVLVATWLPLRTGTIWVAVGCSILVTLGYGVSAEEGILWMVLANRFLALFAIWAAAYLSMGRIVALRNQKDAEVKLSKAELAKAELEGIHKVTATYAHEINNPLTGIVGMVQLLREDTEEGSDERDMLQETLVAAKRIKEVILKMQMMDKPEYKDYLGKTKTIDLDKSS